MTTESSPDLEDKEVIIYDKLFIDEYNATNSMKASEIGLTVSIVLGARLPQIIIFKKSHTKIIIFDF